MRTLHESIAADAMSPLLQSKIASVRTRQSMLAMLRGLCAMSAAAVLLLCFGMLLDFFLELPRWARTALLAIDLTILTYILLWYVVAPLVFAPDDDEIALLVERHRPEFNTRLIASIQLSREGAVPAGASRSLVQRMIAQTEELSREMNFAEVVKPDTTFKAAAISLLVVVLGITGFAFGGEASQDLLQRAFLSNIPVPRKTRVTSISQDLVVAIGDHAVLSASASGIIPASGKVRIDAASGRDQEFSIQPTREDTSRFVRTIENVQEPFRYRIHLNDGHGAWHNVLAVPRPTIVSVDFIQEFPPYTRLQPQRKSPGDLSLLAGAKLAVKLKASKPITRVRVRLVGLERDVSLTINPADRTDISGTLDVPSRSLSGLSIHLTDEHAIVSKGETIYPVDLQPDREPVVRVTWPDRKEELATAEARVLCAFEASDDFGINKVLLRYSLNDDTLIKDIDLDLAPQVPGEIRSLRRRHEFDLAPRKLPEGTVVEWWIEAHDANNVTGPGKTASERYRVKIVSKIEKTAELNNRSNDLLGNIESSTQDQEKLSQRLGDLILKKE